MKRKLDMEYIDGNIIYDVSEDLIQQWIHKLEGDLSILRSELLRRENGINPLDWENGRDLFNRFGLPQINTKDRQ